MSDKKAEGKPEGEAKAATGKDERAPGGSGGVKAWLPLMVSIVLMPVLAFATTKLLILPKVVQARSGGEGSGHEESSSGPGRESSKAEKEHAREPKGSAKKKQTFPISKVIVNVAGSMGARYLMTSFTLVGTHNDFKNLIEANKDQLLDLANTAMASKTIEDLEKPGARNQLRTELISVFNNALGEGLVQEIYFTEFAVQ